MLGKFAGREALPASSGWIVFKTVIQTVVFWSFFLFLLPWAIYLFETLIGFEGWRFGNSINRGCGIGLFICGGILGITCSMIMSIHGRGTPLPMDCARELVIKGPYRYIRNPMAIAGLSQAFAVGIFLGSPAVIIYSLVGGPVWNVLVRPWEEADLEKRFGEPYRRYRAALRCWIPRFPGYRPDNTIQHN